MYRLLVTSLAFASLSIFAMPAVGDKASYKVSMGDMEFISTTELVAFDAATNSFSQKSTTEVMGQTEEDVTTIAMDELMTDENADMLLSLCETDMVKGKLETLTVEAGTFSACTVSGDTGSQSIAKVPFGLVKGEFMNEGVSVKLELLSFTHGQ